MHLLESETSYFCTPTWGEDHMWRENVRKQYKRLPEVYFALYSGAKSAMAHHRKTKDFKTMCNWIYTTCVDWLARMNRLNDRRSHSQWINSLNQSIGYHFWIHVYFVMIKKRIYGTESLFSLTRLGYMVHDCICMRMFCYNKLYFN